VTDAGGPRPPPPAELGDAELVERALDGRPETFEPLYLRHEGYVRWLASKLLADPEEARDCCQEVWLKVRRSLPTYQGRSNFRAWLGTVTTNQARDMRRRQETLRRSLRAALEVHRYEASRAAERFDAQAHGSMVQALDALDDLQRQVVEQRLEDPKVTLDEIGEALGLPRHKVKYAWKTALERLRQRFTEWGAAEGLLAMVLLVGGAAGRTAGWLGRWHG